MLDASGILRAEIATGKAYGALGFGLGSRDLHDKNPKFLAAVGISGDRAKTTKPAPLPALRPRASRPSRAAASGVALLAVLMIIIDGFSTVIFPYQGNPILGSLA